MDKLKDLLNKKKQAMGDNKLVKRGDVEKERADQYVKEQEERDKQKEEKVKRRMEDTIEYVNTYKKLHTENNNNPLSTIMTTKEGETNNENSASNNLNGEESKVDDANRIPPWPKSEVIRRLRELGQVVTYFAETEWARFERLKKASHELEKVDDIKLRGEENAFHKDLKHGNEDFIRHQSAHGVLEDDLDDKKLEERLENSRKTLDITALECKGRKKVNLGENFSTDQKCDDIYFWIKKSLKDWEKDIMNKPDEIRNSTEGKKLLATYRQSRRYLKPLFEVLKNRGIVSEILEALFNIAHLCMLREYTKAHDKYLEIAIGNAPWPMGVTMVGIHERSGRSKIFSSQVAHILNDDTQRKYLQTIKRLMTNCQKYYPPYYLQQPDAIL
jgi:pre-mRNA-splicing factor 18